MLEIAVKFVQAQKDSSLFDCPKLSELLHLLYTHAYFEEEVLLHWHDAVAPDKIKEEADGLIQWLADADYN